MASNNLFYQFQVQPSQNPLAHLRQMLGKEREELRSAPNDNIKTRCRIAIQNLEDFLNFTSSPKQKVLKKTNVGKEGFGTVSVLLNINKTPPVVLEEKKRNELLALLDKNVDIRAKTTYFEESRLPGIYLWWEKGTITKESFGSVHHPIFRGFVKG